MVNKKPVGKPTGLITQWKKSYIFFMTIAVYKKNLFYSSYLLRFENKIATYRKLGSYWNSEALVIYYVQYNMCLID